MQPLIRGSLFLLILLVTAETTLQAVPPFDGTIFIDPDIIKDSDRTTFQGASYTGRGMRMMYDRRVSNWINVNAYLFDAGFDDGLSAEIQVNPEFGSVAAAMAEAFKYGPVIGRLPTSLRSDVATVWIHRGIQPFGGGNNNLLIHTDQANLYAADGILEETLVHEASHTSLDADHAAAPSWLAAQAADGEFISTYARDFPDREDVAESFLPYLAVRYQSDRISQSLKDTIVNTIPIRIAYFDAQAFDLYPVVVNPLGDYNQNGIVDAADYVFWRNYDGKLAGYQIWRAHFGKMAGSASQANAGVPEPLAAVLVLSAVVAMFACRRPDTGIVSQSGGHDAHSRRCLT